MTGLSGYVAGKGAGGEMGTEGKREPCYFEEGGDKGYLSCAVATSHLLLVLNEICYKHRSHTGFRTLSMKKKKKERKTSHK